MSQKNRTVLKTFFQTGDIPTEGQYVDLIDSNLNLSENNTGDIQLTGDITASGTGHISASGDIINTGNILTTNITASNISASGTIIANNFQSTGGDVAGISFTDDLNLTGDLTASGNILNNGSFNSTNITASNNISASGNLSATGDLDIDGKSHFKGNITASLNISASGNLSATGDLDLDGKSHFEGNITASGNISASGTTHILGSTLIGDSGISASNASGTHILGGDLTIGDDLTVGDDLFVTDDIHLGGTNSAHKILQRDSNGNLRIGNDSTLQTGAGNTEIEGLNHITASSDEIKIEATSGPLNLVGNVTASNNISSSGTIIANKANIDGNITASGNSAFLGGNISASGQIFSRRVTTDDFRFHTDTVRLLDDSVSGGGDNLLIYEGGLNAQGNITGSSISASGTLLGNSLNLGGTAITATAAEINHIDGLTSDEASQIKNINSVTISNTQWGYVGNMNQNVNESATPTFDFLTLQHTLSLVSVRTAAFTADISDSGVNVGSVYGGKISITNVPATDAGKQIANFVISAARCTINTIVVANSDSRCVLVGPNAIQAAEFRLNLSTGADAFPGGTIKINFQMLGT